MTKLQERIIYVIQAYPKYNIKQVCRELGINMETLLLNLREISDSGIQIDVVDGEIIRFKWPERNKTVHNMSLGKDHVKLGLLGDTHLASKYDDLDSLNRAYDMIEDKGVDVVFHSGDLVDGIVSTPGYFSELKEKTYTGQLEYAIDRYPKYSGKTLVVSGNHDDYWYRLTGKEIIKDVADKRDDIEYLGSSRRIINIDGLRVNVLHGKFKDSNPINNIYSYLDNIPTYKKPDIVHSGHYHTTKYQDYEGIEMFRSGAFMHQTPHDKKKNHNPEQSMYFVDVYYDDDGNVAEITHEEKTFRK